MLRRTPWFYIIFITDASTAQTFGSPLAAIGGSEVTTFMRGQLYNTMPEKRLEAISEQATCFFRKGYRKVANNVGFRCVKEL